MSDAINEERTTKWKIIRKEFFTKKKKLKPKESDRVSVGNYNLKTIKISKYACSRK